jgi:hypothetical protein
MIKKAGDGAGQMIPLAQTASTGAPTTAQEISKTQGPKGLGIVDGKDSSFAPRLLEAAKARDLDTVKSLTQAWVGAQTNYEALTDGLLALSNFLRAFGSGEDNPKLYANLLSLTPPTDRPMDAGTLELKGGEISGMGPLLQAIAKGHLSGEIDIHSGDNLAMKSLLMAANMGLMTDALKVKMVGWNKLTDQLAKGHVSFELGIRKMPEGSNTNFWVIGGEQGRRVGEQPAHLARGGGLDEAAPAVQELPQGVLRVLHATDQRGRDAHAGRAVGLREGPQEGEDRRAARR